MVPFSESPPILPVEVTGNSEEMRPKEVLAVRLYPKPSGTRTRMDENEVLSDMSRQPLVGRIAVTEIAPF
jgi:fumarate hydratase class II